MNCHSDISKVFHIVLIAITVMLISCQNDGREDIINEETATPEQLTQLFCGDCHQTPDPGLLDKTTWKKILPQQRHFLGLRFEGENPFEGIGLQEGLYLEVANVYPTESRISLETWQRIERYILEQAPDTLPGQEPQDLPITDLFQASLKDPKLGGFPAICMLEFDSVNGRTYVGDVNGFIAELDADFQILNFTQLRNPVVKSIRLHDQNQLLMLDIGILDPKDLPAGAIVGTDLQSFASRTLIFEELTRPTDFKQIDVDSDGLDDFVVCGFGHLVGSLSWYRNSGSGFDPIKISDQAGALKVIDHDVDQDGDIDLIVLFAQGDESIVCCINDGYGRFKLQSWLEFPPSYGSSDFVLQDMDDDGDLDLVVTHGDQSDGSQILKPYHGIRLYLNDGSFHFSEKLHFPMPGAYKVAAEDFDLDGDIDLFGAAFYPDFDKNIDQSLVFLENIDNQSFDAYSLPMAAEGRWMVLDAGDVDDDGDQDIIVGSYALGPGNIPTEVLRKWRSSPNHLLFLENMSN